MSDPTPPAVAERLAEIRRRIAAAAGPYPVEVVAVTKGFGPEAVTAAAAAGLTAIGENYAQELSNKTDAVSAAGVEVHFIGRLQSNKVRALAGIVDVWQTVDRSSLVAEIARRAPGARVLVQVNATHEDGKGGCPPDAVAALVDDARAVGLAVEGLMTVGPTGRPPDDARAGFAAVRRLVDELGLSVCSMGMTDDLEVAVQEGATQIRIGTALFGVRNVRRPVG